MLFRSMFVMAAGVLAAVFSINAAAGLFDDDVARKDLKALREQVDARNRDLDQRLLKIDDSIKNIGVIQLLNQLEQMNAEIARLRGQIEVLSNQNEQLSKRQKDFYLDIDTRLRKVESGEGAPAAGGAVGTGNGGLAGAIPVVVAPPAAVSGVTTPGTPPVISTSSSTTTIRPPAVLSKEQENKAYDFGSDAFRRNDYRGAIRAFDTFMKDFPTSQLVSNAQYWVGISYFNLKEYAPARATQESLVRRFPESAKAPDAMLAISAIQQETGDVGSARNTLQDLIARYPSSDAAAKARARLPTLRR